MQGAVFLRVGSSRICSGFKFGKLFFYKVGIQVICYDKYIFHGDYLLEAVEGLLQQGTSCTEEIQKLFWKCLAAEWPGNGCRFLRP